MNLIRKKWPIKKSTFAVLCCGYVLFALLAYIPGHKIFQYLFLSSSDLPDTQINILIVIPVFCLLVAGFFFFFTIATLLTHHSHFCIRTRFFITLTAVSFLSIVPFIILVCSVTNPLVDAWTNQDVVTAVETGSTIADEYYHYRQLTTKTTIDTYVTMLNMGRDTKSLSWIWPRIRELDPNAASLQIFNMTNSSKESIDVLSIYSENGDSTCFLPISEVSTLVDGIYPEAIEDFLLNGTNNDLIVYVKTLRTGVNARKCIYTSRMYTGFDENIKQLINAQLHTNKIREADTDIRTRIYQLIFVLIFPALLLLPGICYILSSRLASSAEIMTESVQRRNSGSRSLHVLPDEKCTEEKVIGEFINSHGEKIS